VESSGAEPYNGLEESKIGRIEMLSKSFGHSKGTTPGEVATEFWYKTQDNSWTDC
jgi:hypothetical protein